MSKKRASGAWVSDNTRIYNTATDTITTLPAEIIPDGQPISAAINGNIAQSGTPAPQNPIQPQECGDLETEGAKAGQYKIPISSANTTTPVYLGEVETTRKIKKLVLDGTENVETVTSSATGNTVMRFGVTGYLRDTNYIPISSHYVGLQAISGIQLITENNRFAFLVSSSGSNYMYIYDNRYTTAENFKTYLAQQYAAGTPVTVWYVLATETAGIVNEPLRKIGGYSDSVSVTNIPTTAGSQIFDVDTTLKPSEVALSYHGWHPIDNIPEHNNGEWN